VGNAHDSVVVDASSLQRYNYCLHKQLGPTSQKYIDPAPSFISQQHSLQKKMRRGGKIVSTGSNTNESNRGFTLKLMAARQCMISPPP